MALNFPSSPSGNQIYSSGGNSWIWTGYAWRIYSPLGSGINLDDLDDVNVSSASVGQVLVYNGTGWYADNVSGASSSAGYIATGISPAAGSYSYGYRWFNTDTGIEYSLIDDGTTKQWVEMARIGAVSGTVIDGGEF
jgi:hypothetical protein